MPLKFDRIIPNCIELITFDNVDTLYIIYYMLYIIYYILYIIYYILYVQPLKTLSFNIRSDNHLGRWPQ
jgi:uncharacterized MAPEG superfamily protein